MTINSTTLHTWADRLADARAALLSDDDAVRQRGCAEVLAVWNDIDVARINMVIEETRGT